MNLIKVGKSSFKFIVLFLIILTTIIFFDLKKVKAIVPSNQKIVISEVYYNPIGTDTGQEWIVIYNVGEDINLNNYQLSASSSNYTFPNINLDSQNSITIHWNATGNDSATDLYTNTIANADITYNNMGNTSGSVALFIEAKNSSTIIDFLEYGSSGQTWEPTAISASVNIWTKPDFIQSVLEGYSLERKPINQDTNTSVNFVAKSQILPPDLPQLTFPTNGQNLVNPSKINFSWIKVLGVNYEFILSDNNMMFGDGILSDWTIDQVDLNSGTYELVDSLDFGTYYWQIIASNSEESTPSLIFSFTISKPIYSKSIIINEICPHPENGADNEFIELYNTGTKPVDISGWFLDDIEGGSTPFRIPDDTPFILSGEYRTFYKNTIEPKTGIILNDDGDMARLLYPNNEVADTLSYSKADLGLSCARGPTDICLWTTTPTPKAKNVITVPVIVADQTDEPVINTVPIEIPTGDYQNYLDKLVKIRGKVISTSGNTFYLDDGSGVIKVYIQEKTGIDKPEMHRNDIFEIIGVVDLYGQTWRILPRTLNDIILIEQAPVVTKTATAKKTVAKKVVSKAVTVAKSPLISKAVAAAATSPPDKNTDKNDTLSQIVKTSLGLAVMLLVFLIFKLWHQPKTKTSRQLGGHFGDDET